MNVQFAHDCFNELLRINPNMIGQWMVVAMRSIGAPQILFALAAKVQMDVHHRTSGSQQPTITTTTTTSSIAHHGQQIIPLPASGQRRKILPSDMEGSEEGVHRCGTATE